MRTWRETGVLKRAAASNPLGTPARRLYLTGQSQTAGYARTFATLFHRWTRDPGGGPLFDGEYALFTDVEHFVLGEAEPSIQRLVADLEARKWIPANSTTWPRRKRSAEDTTMVVTAESNGSPAATSAPNASTRMTSAIGRP